MEVGLPPPKGYAPVAPKAYSTQGQKNGYAPSSRPADPATPNKTVRFHFANHFILLTICFISRPSWTILKEGIERPSWIILKEGIARPSWTILKEGIARPSWIILKEGIERPSWTILKEGIARPSWTILKEGIERPSWTILKEGIAKKMLFVENPFNHLH